ncbi:MAG: GTPase HflX [Acidobacteriota bacterium]
MTARDPSLAGGPPFGADRAPGLGAYLVAVSGISLRQAEAEEHLDELAALADTAGFEPVGRAVLGLRRPHPATLVGRGQAEDLGVLARALEAGVIVVDEDLTPAQARNLEKVTGLPVVDRAGLIIEIFARHARSREARTQVEMARLEYLLPRLAGMWTHLSRQVGGGPGGTKGEGEKQIELDRRIVRRRIDRLRRELARLDRGRAVRRRARGAVPRVALVGYTNVGKSSLFNAIADAGVRCEDRLFATLDPVVRRVDLGRRGTLLLKDTVGFIRRLPHHLVASFRSTFEEAGEADLLLHVVDLAHPAAREQLEAAERVLDEMGLADAPRLRVYNKIDLAPPLLVRRRREIEPEALFVSARTGEGVEDLIEVLADRLLGRQWIERFALPLEAPELLALAHRRAEITRTEQRDGVVEVTLRATDRVFRELERRGAERLGR